MVTPFRNVIKTKPATMAPIVKGETGLSFMKYIPTASVAEKKKTKPPMV